MPKKRGGSCRGNKNGLEAIGGFIQDQLINSLFILLAKNNHSSAMDILKGTIEWKKDKEAEKLKCNSDNGQ